MLSSMSSESAKLRGITLCKISYASMQLQLPWPALLPTTAHAFELKGQVHQASPRLDGHIVVRGDVVRQNCKKRVPTIVGMPLLAMLIAGGVCKAPPPHHPILASSPGK